MDSHHPITKSQKIIALFLLILILFIAIVTLISVQRLNQNQALLNYSRAQEQVVNAQQPTELSDNLTPSPTPAQNIVAYVNPDGTRGTQCHQGSMGMDFDVVAPIKITALGAFDQDKDGFRSPITVQVMDRLSRQSIATLVISNGPLEFYIDSSRFRNLDQPLLLNGGNYTIVAYGYKKGSYVNPMGGDTSCLDRNGNSSGRPTKWYTQDGSGHLKFVGSSRFSWDTKYPNIIDSGPINRYAAGTFIFQPL